MVLKFFIFFFLNQLVFAAPQALCPVPDMANSSARITKDWYLTHTGADLAKSFTKKNGSYRVGVGVVDSYFPLPKRCADSVKSDQRFLVNLNDIQKIHGHLVSQIMIGETGAGEPNGAFHQIVDDVFRNDLGKFEMEISRARMSRDGLRLINFSMDFDEKPSATKYIDSRAKHFRELTQSGVILVSSAGNEGETIKGLSKFKESFPGIVVGAMSNNGKKWASSQASQKVTILAPGDSLPVKPFGRDPIIKSGTSFAAPLVSGSILNMLQIYPDFNLKQIELLLQKTGLTISDPTKMLNSYKLVRVARRIADMVEFQKFTSKELRDQYVDQLIEAPFLYEFKKEGSDLIESSMTLHNSESCEDLWQATRKAREAYLLTESHQSKQLLAQLYQKMGYELNSQFYDIK